EFLALFPERIAGWLMGGGRVALAVGSEDDRVSLHLLDDNRQTIASQTFDDADDLPARIADFLIAHGVADGAPIGIRLPCESIFSRRLILPVEAKASLDAVVVQDLLGKTPFRLPAIHHDHAVMPSHGAGRIVVWQWVARRDLVADAAERLGLGIERLSFVDAGVGTDDGPPPRIALRRDATHGAAWTRTAAIVLACGIVVLGIAAGTGRYLRQQAMIDDLDLQVAVAKPRAKQVRAAIDRLERKQAVLLRLRSQKADRPGLLDAWEEATKILPAHSWLTELRLSETANGADQLIAMTGFSDAATSLVGVVDRSPLFADASLTAPVALDPVEQRERFALQARLRTRPPIRKASR
ncbi:MAG: PilN domain-containing protein, partial [Xanthobacteraceae bacterium]